MNSNFFAVQYEKAGYYIIKGNTFQFMWLLLFLVGISLNAAKWLVNERQIVGIGIDTPSVDVGSSQVNVWLYLILDFDLISDVPINATTINFQTFPVHVYLAGKEVYGIENVANLHNLINSGERSNCDLHLFVLPLKIIGGTGAPARILAYCK